MTIIEPAVLAVSLTLFLSAAILAQDHSAHQAMQTAPSGDIQLPSICLAAGEPASANSAMMMSMDHPVDEAHQALMAGMDEMNRQMMTGMMAEDIDIAFVCSMIPHHQSAMTMAKAELEHGDDPWARQLAQAVIDAQQQEIADMMAWLDDRAAAERAD